jgi:hypothetical protein
VTQRPVQEPTEAPPDGWSPMATAPRDGSCIWGVTRGGYELRMTWTNGLVNEQGRECGGWIAWVEDAHPVCWHDATCWASNENGEPSDPPVGWMPDTESVDV